ncbi:MAG: glycosyltransferase, partial [Promethearchaeota archaeon]
SRKINKNICSKFNIKQNDIVFIYVGTFNNRNIEVTVESFIELRKKYKNVKYIIIGNGIQREYEKIKNLCEMNKKLGLIFVGYIPYTYISNFLKIAKIGVAYIPMQEKYNYQPTTKLFDYLLAGIPVIATKTYANMKVFKNKFHGILVNDRKEEFLNGMIYMIKNINKFDCYKIFESAQSYSWESITRKKLAKYLEKISMKIMI